MSVSLNEDDLLVIKKLELDILRIIDDVCRKEGIKYFMVGGTLIGAVRHKGFIPWDDDIDIGMLREEYERFLAVIDKYLPSHIKLVNYDTCDEFGEPFSKIMDTSVVFREEFVGSQKMPCGVFVDVFAFDYSPENALSCSRHRFENYFLRKLILLNRGYVFEKQGIKKAVYAIMRKCASVIPVKVLRERYIKNAKRYGRRSSYVVNLGGNYGYKKERVPLEYVDNCTPLSFEGELFMAPVQYDKYLKAIYGDYMKLPPKDKQINRHTVAELDLKKYKEQNK